MSNDLQTIEFDSSKLDLIKRTVAKGATQDEFELFLHACKRTGLDPLMKQIHAIKRWSAAEGRETMAIQTGIDGYRLVAERTGKYAGSDEPVFEMQAGAPYPSKATVTVWKIVEGQRYPFTASAHWDEYVQKKKDGTITSFWQRMPKGQLGKCAESLALRKAFPAELSGVYTHEEMQQAENDVSEKEVMKRALNTPAIISIPEVRPRNDTTMVQPATDKYTGERQEDGADLEDPNTPANSDAPVPSAADFCKQQAQKMSDSPIFTFGKHKGKTPYDQAVPDDYLAWIEPMLAKQIDDPAKARYAAVNQALLAAVRAAAMDRGLLNFEAK